MRRPLAGLAVVSCMLLATQATAEVAIGLSAEYRDTFTSGTYIGSDGTLLWATSWKETGETDGPTQGAIQVALDINCPDGLCLIMSGVGGSEVVQLAATRTADLSMFVDVDLGYDVRRMYDEEIKGDPDAVLYVQVTSDGKTWKTLKSLNINAVDPTAKHESHGIDDMISENFALRFLIQGALAGSVLIDNVEIKGLVGVEPTSTTTTTQGTTTSTRPPITTRPTTTSTTEATTTTTTTIATTTTTVVDDDDDVAIVIPTEPPSNSGIRESERGIQANYDSSLFGEMEMGPEVLSFNVSNDYLIASEVIESSWVWMAGLAAIIAWAVVTNMDRRRRPIFHPAEDS